MKKNIGKIDKAVRLFIGVAIILFGATNNSVWGILGIIPIITSQIGVCPIYSIVGISTNSKEQYVTKK